MSWFLKKRCMNILSISRRPLIKENEISLLHLLNVKNAVLYSEKETDSKNPVDALYAVVN